MAKDVGTTRIPVTGERHGADFDDGLCIYQLKVRKIFPRWLWEWLRGIQGRADRSNRVGVLVVKQPRDRDDEAIVMLAWRDWVGIAQDAGKWRQDLKRDSGPKSTKPMIAGSGPVRETTEATGDSH